MSASKQYPVPSGLYKVKVKNGKDWHRFSHGRIQMSLRNEKYEGDKLFALLEWTSHRFNKIDLVVSDSLVRHNLMFEQGLDEKEAGKQAILMGNQWLSEYQNLIRSFDISVTRWDEWLSHKDFKKSYEAIINQHSQNEKLQLAIKNTVDRFWMRQTQYQEKSYADYAPCATNYMLEELAVFNCMFPEKAAEIYAGQWCGDCVDAIRNSIIPNNTLLPYHDSYYVEVDMSRNKAFQEFPHKVA